MIDSIRSPYIHAADSDNFNTLVVENSHKAPVLVNFCAPHAEPCQRQYPVLEQIIQHYDGRLLLINIDTETEVVLTRQYGITGVPSLKLFRHAQVVASRGGYQSEAELRQLLQAYVARDSDLILADAIQLYAEGKPAAAYEMIGSAIRDDPVNHRLPLTMAKLLQHEGRFNEAIRLLESLPGVISDNQEIRQFQHRLSFFAEADMQCDIDSLLQHVQARPGDLRAGRQVVAHYVVQEDYAAALRQLMAMMEIDPGYQDNYAQQAMLKIFNILGADHALVCQYRDNLRRYTH